MASRLVIIDAGHFVWEEELAKYASAVLDSITGSWPYRRGAISDSRVPHGAGRPQRQGCARRSGLGAAGRPGRGVIDPVRSGFKSFGNRTESVSALADVLPPGHPGLREMPAVMRTREFGEQEGGNDLQRSVPVLEIRVGERRHGRRAGAAEHRDRQVGLKGGAGPGGEPRQRDVTVQCNQRDRRRPGP